MIEFKLEELQSATDDFSPSRLIGKGSHGSVYKGTLPNGKLVAIKKQSSAQIKDGNSKLSNEALILSSITSSSDPRSSCLINYLGISHDKNLLVAEYMPNGTLHNALHSSSSKAVFPWPKRVMTALQIAKALAFLHEGNEPAIVHRDVKSSNVLFDENWDAKLGDFGLALRLDIDGGRKLDDHHLPAGTMGYIDPCYTKPSEISLKVDVYSYGVLLLEISSGRKAIDLHYSPASVVEWALPLIEERRFYEVCDERLHVSRYVIEKMLTIGARCVCLAQDFRPSMSEIVVEMEKIVTANFDSIGTFPFMINFLRRGVINITMRRGRRRRLKCEDATDASGDGAAFPSFS